MELVAGNFYFITDDFFEFIDDPYLKKNYDNTKRPHYYAFRESKTGLYWLVPCSSKVEKFERLIQRKQEQHKPTDTIQIIKLLGAKSVLLFQDMFPITADYIDSQYIRAGVPVCITNPKLAVKMEKTAKKIIQLLRRGVRFTPTQPDVLNIEKRLLKR